MPRKKTEPTSEISSEPHDDTVTALVDGVVTEVPANAIVYDDGVFPSPYEAEISLGHFHLARTGTLYKGFTPILTGPLPNDAYVFMGIVSSA